MENIEYRRLSVDDLNEVIDVYTSYYNQYENGCWTNDIANRRFHQLLSMEESFCLCQKVNDKISGLVLGYIKEYDDIKGYFLEEIVIVKEFQNHNYGTLLMTKLEEIVKNEGCGIIELISVNDDKHNHFYSKCGFDNTKSWILKGKTL